MVAVPLLQVVGDGVLNLFGIDVLLLANNDLDPIFVALEVAHHVESSHTVGGAVDTNCQLISIGPLLSLVRVLDDHDWNVALNRHVLHSRTHYRWILLGSLSAMEANDQQVCLVLVGLLDEHLLSGMAILELMLEPLVSVTDASALGLSVLLDELLLHVVWQVLLLLMVPGGDAHQVVILSHQAVVDGLQGVVGGLRTVVAHHELQRMLFVGKYVHFLDL